MIIELTGLEALILKSAVKARINMFKSAGLRVPDTDEKELNTILEKIDTAYKETYERSVSNG